LLSWTPEISDPMLGVISEIEVPSQSRSLKLGSASLPRSICSKGSSGGYFCAGSQVGR